MENLERKRFGLLERFARRLGLIDEPPLPTAPQPERKVRALDDPDVATYLRMRLRLGGKIGDDPLLATISSSDVNSALDGDRPATTLASLIGPRVSRAKKREIREWIHSHTDRLIDVPPAEQLPKESPSLEGRSRENSTKPSRKIVWFPTNQVVDKTELLRLLEKTKSPDAEKTRQTIIGMASMETDLLFAHAGRSRTVKAQKSGPAREMAGMHQVRVGDTGRIYWKLRGQPGDQELVVVFGDKSDFRFKDSKDGGRSL